MTCWMNSRTLNTTRNVMKSPATNAITNGRISASQSPTNGTASRRLEMIAVGSAAGRPVANITDAVPTP